MLKTPTPQEKSRPGPTGTGSLSKQRSVLSAAKGKGPPGVRTDPGDAARFVAATGVDALPVAVGSSHEMTQRSAQLDQQLIKTLAAVLPVPLVLYGSSGIADVDLRTAAANGIVKSTSGRY